MDKRALEYLKRDDVEKPDWSSYLLTGDSLNICMLGSPTSSCECNSMVPS